MGKAVFDSRQASLCTGLFSCFFIPCAHDWLSFFVMECSFTPLRQMAVLRNFKCSEGDSSRFRPWAETVIIALNSDAGSFIE